MNLIKLPLITLDTCVLTHSFTRKLLLRLAHQHLFSPIWSEEIGKEWRRNAPRIWRVESTVVKQEWVQLQKEFPLANMGEVAPFYAAINEELFPSSLKSPHHVDSSSCEVFKNKICSHLNPSDKHLIQSNGHLIQSDDCLNLSNAQLSPPGNHLSPPDNQLSPSDNRLSQSVNHLNPSDNRLKSPSKALYYCLQPENKRPLENYLFKRIDKKDRHIALCALLAAKRYTSKQNILLTWNIGDFHRRELREQDIDLKTPDIYLSELFLTHKELLTTNCLLAYQEHLTLSNNSISLIGLLRKDRLFRFANLIQHEIEQN